MGVTLLALDSTKSAYLSMLFIHEQDCGAVQHKNSIPKQAKYGGNHASEVELGSYGGTWYSEYDGTTLLVIFHILME